jgi:hypothetical protein
VTDPVHSRREPPAVEKRLALAVDMLDAAVIELRALMAQLKSNSEDGPLGPDTGRDQR